MNLIIKDRGAGKTTRLIFASEVTQYPIVVSHGQSVNYIRVKAEELGCNIPDPITVDSFLAARKGRSTLPENVLFDEVGSILEQAINAYLGTNVVGATMSYKMRGGM